eukprot:CCRYP_016691-RC/>CCRYP_016691-RC protein AED:0.38 eAED:0.38 QI:0/0/0/1/0/0/2/0/391
MSSCDSACTVSHRQGCSPTNYSKRLNAHGYHQSKLVPGLWKHIWRPIQFTLVVDDFGIKYVGDEHPQHLLTVLQEHYSVTTDWQGAATSVSPWTGTTTNAAFTSQCQATSKGLRNMHPFRPCPSNMEPATQCAKAPSTAALLDPKGKKFIQQVCGKFLFLGRAVDPTLLCPISAIASQSSKPTVETLKQTKQLLDYIATQDEAVLTYNASDMVLAIHSDASYLSEPAHAAEQEDISFSHPMQKSHTTTEPSSTLPTSSNMSWPLPRSRTGGTLHHGPRGSLHPYYPGRTWPHTTCHPAPNRQLHRGRRRQWKDPTQTDQSHGHAIPLARDRECQEQFRIYWRPGKLNYADYWTKHHPVTHHQHIRQEFITPQLVVAMLRLSQRTQPAASAA